MFFQQAGDLISVQLVLKLLVNYVCTYVCMKMHTIIQHIANGSVLYGSVLYGSVLYGSVL